MKKVHTCAAQREKRLCDMEEEVAINAVLAVRKEASAAISKPLKKVLYSCVQQKTDCHILHTITHPTSPTNFNQLTNPCIGNFFR
jgi:hypothetical protein